MEYVRLKDTWTTNPHKEQPHYTLGYTCDYPSDFMPYNDSTFNKVPKLSKQGQFWTQNPTICEGESYAGSDGIVCDNLPSNSTPGRIKGDLQVNFGAVLGSDNYYGNNWQHVKNPFERTVCPSGSQYKMTWEGNPNTHECVIPRMMCNK